jgi:hypothetical protein
MADPSDTLEQRHVLHTRLSPEECCARLEARCLPLEGRWALQRRWQTPPKQLPVTGIIDTNGFLLHKTTPILALGTCAVGLFTPTPDGTQIGMYLLSGGRLSCDFPLDPPQPASRLRLLLWQAGNYTVGMVARIAFSFDFWGARERRAFLLQFVQETLDATDVPGEQET